VWWSGSVRSACSSPTVSLARPGSSARGRSTSCYRHGPTRTQDPVAVALLEDALTHADPAALRNAIVSISLRRSDLTQRLAEISVPTLFVTGSDHKGWTPPQAVAASKVLPYGSTAVVADASYLVPFENPAATIQLVRQFWDDHSSSITPT